MADMENFYNNLIIINLYYINAQYREKKLASFTHFFFMAYLCMGDFFIAFISIVISAGAIVNEDFLAAEFPGLLICEDRLCIDGTCPPVGVLTLPPGPPGPAWDKLKPFISLRSF